MSLFPTKILKIRKTLTFLKVKSFYFEIFSKRTNISKQFSIRLKINAYNITIKWTYNFGVLWSPLQSGILSTKA